MIRDDVIFYSDEQNDDFASTHGKIKTLDVTESYSYFHESAAWHIFSFFLYRFIAIPLTFAFMKICFGMKIKNKEAVHGLKGGYFLYGNHTQTAADAFIPSFAAFPRRTNIIVSADAVSIPAVKKIVPMLGAIPLSSTVRGRVKFLRLLSERTDAGQVTTVYPEAHIWPYYNKIRSFRDGSFAYPFMFGVPAVGFTVTYRQRRIFPNLPPLITVTLSEPVFPCECHDKREMRDRIYGFMCETVEREGSFAYKKYEKRTEPANDNHTGL